MNFDFTLNRRRRELFFYTALIFLLQSIAPALQGAMAQSVNGYTDTICTMYGPKTVFVPLDDGQPQESPKCWQCAVCVLQANLVSQPVLHAGLLDARLPEDAGTLAARPDPVPNPLFFAHFLGRAPPA